MAGPPLYVFIMLGVVPFVYSLPIALIVRAHRCGSHSLMQSTCCPRVHLALVCVCVSRGAGGGERSPCVRVVGRRALHRLLLTNY